MSGGEIFLILFVAFMLFGSDKLPDIARTLGKGINQFKQATDEIKREIANNADVKDIKKSVEDLKDDVTKSVKQ